jgi:ergothioneine biosynthesis protein EgtB
MLDQLAGEALDDAALYPYRLVLAHEDMHGEALLYTLQKLAVAAPATASAGRRTPGQRDGGEIAYPGGTIRLGGEQDGGFVFDNERGAHACRVEPFRIDSALVTNARFSEFVDDGGYQHPQFWTQAGRDWLMQQERSAPRYWQRDGRTWRTVRFGRVTLLEGAEAVRHVSLYEAQAYCAWSGRRLPLESEWEYAAGSRQPGFGWGELWEWTAAPFGPYPGFAPDRYRDYSLPWFGTHQVLRGASFATPQRLLSPHFRNFYQPGRDDIFAGFRTCAL